VVETPAPGARGWRSSAGPSRTRQGDQGGTPSRPATGCHHPRGKADFARPSRSRARSTGTFPDLEHVVLATAFIAVEPWQDPHRCHGSPRRIRRGTHGRDSIRPRAGRCPRYRPENTMFPFWKAVKTSRRSGRRSPRRFRLKRQRHESARHNCQLPASRALPIAPVPGQHLIQVARRRAACRIAASTGRPRGAVGYFRLPVSPYGQRCLLPGPDASARPVGYEA